MKLLLYHIQPPTIQTNVLWKCLHKQTFWIQKDCGENKCFGCYIQITMICINCVIGQISSNLFKVDVTCNGSDCNL